MPTGRPHPPEFKAKVVMQVISGEKTLNDVAAEHDLDPNLVGKWRGKFEQEACRAFSAAEDGRARERELAERREGVDGLYRMIGRLTAERPACPKPNLPRPRKGAKRHRCLLKDEEILFPNRVWAAGITYAPIGKARMHPVAVIGWHGRRIVGWRLLDGMAAPGVVARMRDAIEARSASPWPTTCRSWIHYRGSARSRPAPYGRGWGTAPSGGSPPANPLPPSSSRRPRQRTSS